MVICADEVAKALERFAGRIHRTPILTCQSIDEIAGCKVYMKGEHLQKTGSFKARGALNAVQKMKDNGPVSGVVTHSSGNHGQGLAWAASQLQLPCWVAVPGNAPPSKIEAMQCYGAQVEFCEATHKSRFPYSPQITYCYTWHLQAYKKSNSVGTVYKYGHTRSCFLDRRIGTTNNVFDPVGTYKSSKAYLWEHTCAELAKKFNYRIVEPFDDQDVICGQIVEQVPDADAIFVAVGGGGMSSGVTAYVNEVRPDIRVFLVEPEGKDLSSYLNTGQLTTEKDVVNTIADGIRVLKVGENCYPILKNVCADRIITVNDDEIRAALRLIWTRTKQRVEPSAAVPLAGLLKVSPSELGLNKVVLVLCGGNVDIDFIP